MNRQAAMLCRRITPFVLGVAVALGAGCLREPRLHRGLSDPEFDAKVQARIRECDSVARVKRALRRLDTREIRESSAALSSGWSEAPVLWPPTDEAVVDAEAFGIVRARVGETLGASISNAIPALMCKAVVDAFVTIPAATLFSRYPAIESGEFEEQPLEVVVVFDAEHRAIAAYQSRHERGWRRIELRGRIRHSREELHP